ncbi:MAG: Gfo/Idh/MocA family protein, partial [Tepidisphaeraceae bacterium]
MTRTFRVVLIGVGAVADAIARALRDLNADGVAQLVAGSCRTREKGERFAATYGCKWYGDTTAMLDAERPDVAIVATPSGAHLDAALPCFERRVHVLCEKPLEITTERCRKMIAAADDAGVTLGGIFPQRYNPVTNVIRRAARDGRFGNLSTVSVTVPWWRDDAYYGKGRWQGTLALDGGGALMNQGIHNIDLLQWLAAATMPDLSPDQSAVEEVFAYTARRGHDPSRVEVEDTAVATVRFRNGALGQILAATSIWPGSLRRVMIAGRDGTAELIEDQLVAWQFRTELPDDTTVRAQ